MPPSGIKCASGMWPAFHSHCSRTSTAIAPFAINSRACSAPIFSTGGIPSSDMCPLIVLLLAAWGLSPVRLFLLQEQSAEVRHSENVFVANERHLDETFRLHIAVVVGNQMIGRQHTADIALGQWPPLLEFAQHSHLHLGVVVYRAHRSILLTKASSSNFARPRSPRRPCRRRHR